MEPPPSEPQGTVVFDFEEYALPASDIELYDVERVGNRYYCRFAAPLSREDCENRSFQMVDGIHQASNSARI